MDSERVPLMVERRHGRSRRSVIRWLPDFSAGSVGVILSVAAGIVSIYVDNGKRDERIATIQKDREQDRAQVAATLQEIKGDLRETTRAVNETKESVATVKAQLTVLQTTQSNPRSSR